MTAPPDWLTTLGLVAATLASVAACGAALYRTFGEGERPRLERLERRGVIAVAVLCTAVFVHRALFVHGGWEPLSSHVDGMTLLGALLAAVTVYLQWSERLRGVDVFALPVLAVITLWGVCASWWTLREFHIGGVWSQIHLWSIYLSTLSVATAAAAGGLYLLVDRQLRSRDHRRERLKRLGKLGNLESIESAIVVAATAGFVLLTIALPTGAVVLGNASAYEAGWWYSPKIVLAALVWLIFAAVMHVRFVPSFRGRRAALLSIVGFVLLLASMGFAINGGNGRAAATEAGVAPDKPRSAAVNAAASEPGWATHPWHPPVTRREGGHG